MRGHAHQSGHQEKKPQPISPAHTGRSQQGVVGKGVSGWRRCNARARRLGRGEGSRSREALPVEHPFPLVRPKQATRQQAAGRQAEDSSRQVLCPVVDGGVAAVEAGVDVCCRRRARNPSPRRSGRDWIQQEVGTPSICGCGRGCVCVWVGAARAVRGSPRHKVSPPQNGRAAAGRRVFEPPACVVPRQTTAAAAKAPSGWRKSRQRTVDPTVR